jgi:FixJ family two-component response regulator
LPDATLISIVDDDDWARGGLESLVQSIGFETRAFASAEQFLAAGGIAESDCLIADLNMPGMSGLELQQKLRREGHCTPVIIVTAYQNELHRTRALDAGAAAFLTKPFGAQQLVDCLMQALARGDSGPSARLS